MDKTPKNDKVEEVKAEATKVEAKPGYRYVCDACTGIAFYSQTNEKVQKTPKSCQACFAPLDIIKVENFIKL
jgi:hypothetical protein